MILYQAQLELCKEIYESYESLAEKSLQLHQEALRLSFGGFKSLDIDNRIKVIERQARNNSMSINAINESLISIQDDINKKFIFSEETRNVLKEIEKLTQSVLILQNQTMTYVQQTRDCLSQTVVGVIIQLCQEIVNKIKSSLIVVIKVAFRFIPKALIPGIVNQVKRLAGR